MPDIAPLALLVAGLEAPDRYDQADAARLLGELGRGEAVGALRRYVTESRYYSKMAGFHALARIGDAAVCPTLRGLVDKPNVVDDWFWLDCRAVRAAAALALLALGDESRAGYLAELADAGDDVFFCFFGPTVLRLPDNLPAARDLKARITVGAMADPAARGVRHTDPARVALKAEVFGLLATPEACEALRDLVAFHSRYVRGQAAVSLLSADPSEEHVRLVEAMGDGDPADFARVRASYALAAAGRGDRIALIVEAAEALDDPFDRAVAVECLGLLEDETHAGVVERQASHADPYVRQCAVEALDRLGAASAAAVARKRLGDDSLRVRLQAAKLLAALDGKEGR